MLQIRLEAGNRAEKTGCHAQWVGCWVRMSRDRASARTESAGMAFTVYSSNASGLILACPSISRWRPYRVECTGSLLTSEVKRLRARLVLGSGTAWEYLRVLSAFCAASQLIRLAAADGHTERGRASRAPASRRARTRISRASVAPATQLVRYRARRRIPATSSSLSSSRARSRRGLVDRMWILFGDHPLKLERYRED